MAAHLIPWGTSFNSLPVGTNKVGDTPVFIRQSRQGIAERLKKEHNMNLTDTLTDNQGKHNEGSSRCFISNTTVATPDVTVETVYVEGETPDFKNGRQYFNPETNKLYVYVTDYTYTDAYGNSHTVDGFTEVTAAVPQLTVATCVTAQATVAKVVTIPNFVLTEGAEVLVKFTYAGVDSATLNINDTGAKTIYYNGSAVVAANWSAGDTVRLQYSGTVYRLIQKFSTTSATKPLFIGNITGSCNTADVAVYSPVSRIERITSGSGNWTVPAGVTRIKVTCIGGGGGGGAGSNAGAGSPTSGGDGGDTTFFGATTGFGAKGGGAGLPASPFGCGGAGALGGAGSAGGTGGIGNTDGGTGGGAGAVARKSDFTYSPAGYGGGGAGGAAAGTISTAIAGGGGGGTAISNVLGDVIDVTPGETRAYSVGAGGIAGTNADSNGYDGTAGGSGIIIIEY